MRLAPARRARLKARVSPTRSRLPLVALALTGVSAALLALPELAARLSFERAALAAQPWRFLSGHLVHTRDIAAFDLVVWLALGAWWELRSRAAFVAILLTSAVAASLALVVATSFTRYVGSSALSSGLFVAGVLELALERRGGARFLAGLLLVLFVVKCTYEASGHAVFVELPADVHVAAAAHLAGGAGGALVVWARSSLVRSRRKTSGRTHESAPRSEAER
jgi:membrane associated rhomboid family serine protease